MMNDSILLEMAKKKNDGLAEYYSPNEAPTVNKKRLVEAVSKLADMIIDSTPN